MGRSSFTHFRTSALASALALTTLAPHRWFSGTYEFLNSHKLLSSAILRDPCLSSMAMVIWNLRVSQLTRASQLSGSSGPTHLGSGLTVLRNLRVCQVSGSPEPVSRHRADGSPKTYEFLDSHELLSSAVLQNPHLGSALTVLRDLRVS